MNNKIMNIIKDHCEGIKYMLFNMKSTDFATEEYDKKMIQELCKDIYHLCEDDNKTLNRLNECEFFYEFNKVINMDMTKEEILQKMDEVMDDTSLSEDQREERFNALEEKLMKLMG